MFEFSTNFPETIFAAVAIIITGMLWFGPLFSKTWMKETGITMKDVNNSNMTTSYLTAAVMALVTASIFSALVSYLSLVSLKEILKLSFILWLGFTAPAMLNKVIWGKDSLRLYTIESLHQLTSFLVVGLVIYLV